jgi:hypothetical protein
LSKPVVVAAAALRPAAAMADCTEPELGCASLPEPTAVVFVLVFAAAEAFVELAAVAGLSRITPLTPLPGAAKTMPPKPALSGT